MLLAIDAGNTNIVIAVYDGDEQKCLWRCQTNSGRTSDEYAAWLYQLFMKETLAFSDIKHAIISSVVPDATYHLETLCRNAFDCAPFIVSHQTVALPIKLDKPWEIGADRLVNAVAVSAFHHCPAVVVDFGTATTFDVIDKQGRYCGGVIAPGVNLSMEALYAAAAKLPKIRVQKAEKVIGNDTVSAMQSGVYWGYVAMIEGMLSRISAEMQATPLVIATGGLSVLFSETIAAINIVDQNLTLRGLLHIHKSHAIKAVA